MSKPALTVLRLIHSTVDPRTLPEAEPLKLDPPAIVLCNDATTGQPVLLAFDGAAWKPIAAPPFMPETFGVQLEGALEERASRQRAGVERDVGHDGRTGKARAADPRPASK